MFILHTPSSIKIKGGKAVLQIRIRDPGLGTFLTPGSGIRDPGWKKVSIRIRDPG